jgi:hypothetical protein
MLRSLTRSTSSLLKIKLWTTVSWPLKSQHRSEFLLFKMGRPRPGILSIISRSRSSRTFRSNVDPSVYSLVWKSEKIVHLTPMMSEK